MSPDEIRAAIDCAWPRPWSFGMNGFVLAANGTIVCEVRGWGRLTGTGGGMALAPIDASDVQDCLGMTIAAEHNATVPKPAPIGKSGQCVYVSPTDDGYLNCGDSAGHAGLHRDVYDVHNARQGNPGRKWMTRETWETSSRRAAV